MKYGMQKILRKTAKAFFKPLLDQHLATLDRRSQMLLFLKYQELEPARRLDFEQVGFNVYSSTHEDGILLYILSRIGLTNRKFVDIGAGSVVGSNVANLIVNHGFDGLLIDGDPRNIQGTREYYLGHPETQWAPPRTVAKMITAENVNDLLEENGLVGEIDLFCLDIDGIDYWIWKALEVISPRVVVVEYQDILGPDKAWTVPYKPDFDIREYPVNKRSNNYCGASLRAFVELGKQKGYRLVGCNKGGWNAFFVKNGIGDMELPATTVESCFKYEWNKHGMAERFPLVEKMEWQEV